MILGAAKLTNHIIKPESSEYVTKSYENCNISVKKRSLIVLATSLNAALGDLPISPL